MKSSDENQTSKSLLNKFLTPQQAAYILTEAQYLDRSRFVDKGKYQVRKGIDGRTPQYHYAGNLALPEYLQHFLANAAPKGLGELAQYGINWYKPGDFIPVHKDIHQYRNFVLIFLDSKENVYRHYSNGIDKPAIEIPDKAGYGITYTLDNFNTPHEVLPTEAERYSLLYFYD